MLYFSNPAVHANESYQVIFPPDVDWATHHAKTDFATWPLARGPFVGRDFAPGTDLSWWKNHPYPISFFVWTGRGRLPRRLRSRQARRRRARGRPGHDARQEVLDLGQRARRADVGPDPHRRGRPLHRAHDRRLLRQPARLLLDPAGRDAHRRPLLVPGARARRRQGRQPRRRAQPRGEGRPGPRRRQHDDPPARRAVRLTAGRAGRLRASRDDRARRAVRARGRPCRPASARRTCAWPSCRGRSGAGRLREPQPPEGGRAEAVRAAPAARPGEDGRGALPRRPAPRAVPQPPLRPRGLVPRGAAPRPRRRAHEHRPGPPRPAPRAVRRRREAPRRPRSRA